MLIITKTVKGQMAYELQFEDGDTEEEIQIAIATISLLKSTLTYLNIIKEVNYEQTKVP